MATALKIVPATRYTFTRINRDGNEFTMDIAESANGVYMVDLAQQCKMNMLYFLIIQVFLVISYESVTGYKQNRICFRDITVTTGMVV